MFDTGPASSARLRGVDARRQHRAGANAFDARINGGLQSGDEATVDGVSMQQGFMSQGGMVSIIQDFPMSPDMVSEVKVLTSNYAPEYGASLGGQIMAVTKSGGSTFHGAAFEYHRNDALNATQWGAAEKGERSTRTTSAPTSAGPAKLPGLTPTGGRATSTSTIEGYRQKGGSNQPTLSIPSMRERQATSATGATRPAT